MSLSKKAKIFIGAGLAVAFLFVALVGYGVWSLYSFFNRIRDHTKVEIPHALAETKVFAGGDFLTKKEIFKLKPLSYSEIISRSMKIPDEQARQQFVLSETSKGIYGFDDLKICVDEIVAAGKFGGYVFDSNGTLKREIYFEPTERTIKIGWYEQKEHKADLDNLKIIELDNRGGCGFLSHGYREGATVYDLNGKRIWNYGAEPVADLGKMLSEKDEEADKRIYVTEAAAGDLDGDGSAEFIVARRNDGIRAFDQNNNEKWFQPDEFPTATMIVMDADGDGKNELLEIGSDPKIRNSNGEVIKSLQGNFSSNAFLFTTDKDKKKNLQSCSVYQNKLICFDEKKEKFLQAEAALSDVPKNPAARAKETPIYIGNGEYLAPSEDDTENVYEPKAVWVNLQKGKPKYLAVLASFINVPRSNFYIYDEQGILIYHELLPEDAETLAIVPSANQAEEILIGGKDTIWKFAAK